MGVALKLYEQLTDAGEDKARARLIAEAFEALESRYPDFKDMATQGHVRESELRLQKEIKEVEARLTKDIKEVEARLTKDIKELEAKLTKGIKDVEVRLTQAIHRQTIWVVVAVGGVTGLIRWLDVLLR